MKLYTGTSGYSYKEWTGNFYPEKIKPSEMLGYYSERLGTVEINNTFYRMPKKDILENWKWNSRKFCIQYKGFPENNPHETPFRRR